MSEPCINCGAAITFEQAGGELLERLVCPYCGAANLRAQAERLKRQERERASAHRARELRRFITIVVGASLLLLGIGVAVKLRSDGERLANRYAVVEKTRAQVKNVKERQLETIAHQQYAEPSEAREAELAGAENRVRIERKRYDEAASAYNVELRSFFSKWAAKVRGLPPAVELSNEVRW
ncbi:MAG: LemA family protein [Archangium sp.]